MKKDCKFCDKKGLMILPLRYSVALADDMASLRAIPALPSTLGKGVSDLVLTKGKYAPAMLRSGYLYVLIDREGIKSWEGYQVTQDAYLYKFPVDVPPQTKVEFTCAPNSCGIDASMISIEHASEIEKVYFLFTPTAMTKAKLDEYKKNATELARQGKMQVFNPKAWLAGSTNQPHAMQADEMHTHTTEWILHKQSKQEWWQSRLGPGLENQLFPPAASPKPDLGLVGAIPAADRLTPLYLSMRDRGAASFVVYDHIGITQELNNFRNAALEPIEQFLETKDSEGVDNRRKMDVAHAIEDIKYGFMQHGIGLAQKQVEFMDSRHMPDFRENTAKNLRSMGRIAEAEKVEEDIKRSHATREANRQKILSGADAEREWKNKYAKLLDMDGIKKFGDDLAALSEACGKKADSRADDHLQWLVADRLVDAFDTYDPNNLGSGFCFTQEHSVCTFGMFGIDKNKPKLAEWMNVSKVERKNLYMRANLYNHKSLEEEAAKAFTEARQLVATAGSLGAVASAPWLKAGKGLIDVLKKTDSAWDEWLRDKVVKGVQSGSIEFKSGDRLHNLSTFHRSNEGRMYARIAEWSQALSNKAGKMDKGIQAVVGMMLYGRLGKLAEEISFEAFMLKVPPDRLAEGYRKRSAQRNLELAERDAAKKAGRTPRQLFMEDPIEVLIRDEQRKVRDKVKIALDELDKGKRPETNNFRQARMGVLLMSIEGLALTLKLTDNKELTYRGKAEVVASAFSLIGMTLDLVYAVTKSLREIEPFKSMATVKIAPLKSIATVDTAADLIRGGLKMAAGTFSAAAGATSMLLDIYSGVTEAKKDRTNWVLASLYFSRAGVSLLTTGIGLIAAFSYTVPILTRISENGTVIAKRFAPLLTKGMFYAEKFMAARTIWLIRLARFNLIGFAFTAGEVIYRCWIMDDDLENWCQACCFRKDRSKGWLSEKPYPDATIELRELEKAYKAIAQ
ncbi:T6SS effector BTH_I2691 family protein [Pseudoduganella sp. R-43]|uniref:T6SS effector BTH_I2691 family protein n=1 Tax=Pseudoduganella sp. R-43 TaxID=3404063 RepID=UPI003CE8AD12